MSTIDLPKNAQADDGTQSADDFESLAPQKVQLDIDDAPFLQDEKKEALPVPATSDTTLKTKVTAPPPAPKSKKKLFIFAVLLLLLGGAAAAYFFFFRGDKPPVTPPPEPPVIIVPSTSATSSLPFEYTLKLEPFWVPTIDQSGQNRFVVATFTLATADAVLFQEMQEKTVVLRDAIYYYLSNKSYSFLLDPDHIEIIRSDLTGTANNYLVQGELKSLYFDSYLPQ